MFIMIKQNQVKEGRRVVEDRTGDVFTIDFFGEVTHLFKTRQKREIRVGLKMFSGRLAQTRELCTRTFFSEYSYIKRYR